MPSLAHNQSSDNQQVTDTIFMVRPAAFGYNAETAASNAFQSEPKRYDREELARRAQREFDEMVNKLRRAGVNVIVGLDDPEPAKPDAVFPNNWVSFHQDGTVVLYPMMAPVRRIERDMEYIRSIQRTHVVDHLRSYTDHEAQSTFLEGTGSMLLDRQSRIVYACLSDRTDRKLLKTWAEDMGYEPVIFHSVDDEGLPIYHTNVMMALGEHLAILASDTIRDVSERNILLDRLKKTGKEVIGITMDQVNAYAGNMLQVRNTDGEPIMVMSETAYTSLRADQIERIEAHCKILFIPIHLIEWLGGGSVRCMMAEVFLPLRSADE